MSQGIPAKQAEIIEALLRESSLPRDALPYTEEFERLRQEFRTRTATSVPKARFWQHLVAVGKRMRVGNGGRRKRAPRTPPLNRAEQAEILRLMPGGLGGRDRLPYTREFDELYRWFQRLTGSTLDRHEFWRGLSRLAKAPSRPKPSPQLFLAGLPFETVEALEVLNPWWRGTVTRSTPAFRRWAFYEAWRLLHNDVTPAVTMRGARQVGKTTIQEQFIDELLRNHRLKPSQILRVQFDVIKGLGILQQPMVSIVRWFEKHVLRKPINECAAHGTTVYLFFDEVQNLATWPGEIKFLLDHIGVKALITGSSSLRIYQGQDSLAGRTSLIELGPLRLSEIIGIRHLGEAKADTRSNHIQNWTDSQFWLDVCSKSKEQQDVVRTAFEHFAEVGGYPICHKTSGATRADLAEEIERIVVSRTIDYAELMAPRRRAWDKELLRAVFRLVCRYTGQAVRPDRICSEVNRVYKSSVKTSHVSQAIQYLADCMLIHQVQPLEVALKRQTHPAKLCLCDHFVREACLQETVPLSPRQLTKAKQSVYSVAGHVMESIIGYHLKGILGLDVAWFPARRKKRGQIVEPEVDYVLTMGLQRIPIEVKYTRGRPTRKDLAGLESFCSQQKYNAPFGLCITQEIVGRQGKHVIAVPAPLFLSVF